ncbi:aspartic proteinase Asp1-like [Tripterygium wilfordii]|uniref:aspartic proteinase Asp1-like n=1 Tax=Tripterygium wilfordii TaxID=458696 RepID=UPI0018F839D1|nr:aspartic proteinase Asp1-like [Tripterygium wilfordii]
MESKTLIPKPTMVMMVVLQVALYTAVQSHLSQAILQDTSSIVFPLSGSIHTHWAYMTTINIGKPHKPFKVHVDTASELTWPKEHLYKPKTDSIVKCEDPLCVAIQGKERNCENPDDRCEYVIPFSDGSKTHGYLVRDIFPIRLTTGSIIDSPLVFGCGYKQIGAFRGAGMLGLSRGPVGFLSQIHSQGLIKQVMGHCLSSQEGGFLFLGDDLVPHTGVSWTPITNNYHEDRDYLSGPVDLLFDGKATQVTGLKVDFDSGSALSWLNQSAYQHTLDLINQALKKTKLKPAEPEGELSVCWSHKKKPIISLDKMNNKYFKKLTLSFKNIPNVKLELPPQAYLILIKGKVCLGIDDGDKLGLQNPNLIGAISMQDKLVMYDNVNHRIGWASRDCKIPPML